MKTTGLRGISEDGGAMVQTKQGGGYMLLARGRDRWVRVAESRYYADACALLDEFVAQSAAFE